MPASSRDDGNDILPFDVELERLPSWAHAASALVVGVSVLVTLRVVPMVALLPFLVVSSIGRRLVETAAHLEVASEDLTIDAQRIRRDDILDVWLDPGSDEHLPDPPHQMRGDRVEPHVIVAIRTGEAPALLSCRFVNVEQAKRFADALGPAPDVVAGACPRPVDLLPSLRFAAIAGAFFQTGSWFGLIALVFFGASAFTVMRARQLVVRSDACEIRSIFGARVYVYPNIVGVDVDAGVIDTNAGVIKIPRSAIRDTVMAAPKWVDRARARALESLRRYKNSA